MFFSSLELHSRGKCVFLELRSSLYKTFGFTLKIPPSKTLKPNLIQSIRAVGTVGPVSEWQ